MSDESGITVVAEVIYVNCEDCGRSYRVSGTARWAKTVRPRWMFEMSTLPPPPG